MQRLLRAGNDEVAIFVELAEDMSGFKRLLDQDRAPWTSCAGALSGSIGTQKSSRQLRLASNQVRFKSPNKAVIAILI